MALETYQVKTHGAVAEIPVFVKSYFSTEGVSGMLSNFRRGYVFVFEFRGSIADFKDISFKNSAIGSRHAEI